MEPQFVNMRKLGAWDFLEVIGNETPPQPSAICPLEVVARIIASGRTGSLRRATLRRLRNIRGGVHSTEFFNQDAIEERNGGLRLATKLSDGIAALPPLRPFLKQGARVFPAFTVIGVIRDFHVAPERNNARPIIMCVNFIRLDADQRIFAHPLNFLSQRREAIQALAVVHEINRNDVRAVIRRTGQSPKSKAG